MVLDEIARYLQSQGSRIILNGVDKSRLLDTQSELNADFIFMEIGDSEVSLELEKFLSSCVAN